MTNESLVHLVLATIIVLVVVIIGVVLFVVLTPKKPEVQRKWTDPKGS